jgi:hypothetical protein
MSDDSNTEYQNSGAEYPIRQNTDREIWRGPDEGCGDFYADSLHITQEGALGINCGGRVIVKLIREWHRLASGDPSLAIAQLAKPRLQTWQEDH